MRIRGAQRTLVSLLGCSALLCGCAGVNLSNGIGDYKLTEGAKDYVKSYMRENQTAFLGILEHYASIVDDGVPDTDGKYVLTTEEMRNLIWMLDGLFKDAREKSKKTTKEQYAEFLRAREEIFNPKTLTAQK